MVPPEESASNDVTFRPLPARVGEREAEVFFRRRHLWLFRRIGRLQLLDLELVYLPLYVAGVTFRERQQEGPADFLLSVDAVTGNARRFPADLDLSQQGPEDFSGTMLPADFSETLALARALVEAPGLSLRQGLKEWTAGPVQSVRLHDRIAYPYWVQHLEYRQRRDFRAIDAVSGKAVGPKGRSALLQGIIACAAVTVEG